LAGFGETINPSVSASDGLESSTMRKRQGRGEAGEMGMGLDNTFYFLSPFSL